MKEFSPSLPYTDFHFPVGNIFSNSLIKQALQDKEQQFERKVWQ